MASGEREGKREREGKSIGDDCLQTPVGQPRSENYPPTLLSHFLSISLFLFSLKVCRERVNGVFLPKESPRKKEKKDLFRRP